VLEADSARALGASVPAAADYAIQP